MGYISAHKLKSELKKVLLYQFQCKPRPSGVSLESLELEYIPQVPGNWAIEAQNHDARKAVSCTLSALKWNGLYFGPKTRKSAFKNFRCVHFTANQEKQELVESPRDWKISPKLREINPKFTLASLWLEYIPQVSGNKGEIGQNHDSLKTVSPTLSVLK